MRVVIALLTVSLRLPRQKNRRNGCQNNYYTRSTHSVSARRAMIEKTCLTTTNRDEILRFLVDDFKTTVGAILQQTVAL